MTECSLDFFRKIKVRIQKILQNHQVIIIQYQVSFFLTFLTFEIETSQDLNITLSKCFKYPTCFQWEIFKKTVQHFYMINSFQYSTLVYSSLCMSVLPIFHIVYRSWEHIIKMCLFKCSISKGICRFLGIFIL